MLDLRRNEGRFESPILVTTHSRPLTKRLLRECNCDRAACCSKVVKRCTSASTANRQERAFVSIISAANRKINRVCTADPSTALTQNRSLAIAAGATELRQLVYLPTANNPSVQVHLKHHTLFDYFLVSCQPVFCSRPTDSVTGFTYSN